MKWAVVLAGGSGTRFWPLSTPEHPKQLLPLIGDESTAEQAVNRLVGLVPPERVLIVSGEALATPLRARLALPAENFLVEPIAASTAPALVWASVEARRRDPEAAILSLHADWAIPDPAAFRRTAETALDAARRHDQLITVGIVPTRPDTGYGYILPGPLLDDAMAADGRDEGGVPRGVRQVARFTEKPDTATAGELIAQGALWNSGLFAWTADRLVAEIETHTPELHPYLARLERGDVEGFFRSVTPVSIDVGVLERSQAVGVVRGAFAWDDIGTWTALTRVRPRDAAGNVAVGEVFLEDSRDCVVWSDRETVVLWGVSDLVVVRANGRILVMPADRAPAMKTLLDAMPPAVREVHS